MCLKTSLIENPLIYEVPCHHQSLHCNGWFKFILSVAQSYQASAVFEVVSGRMVGGPDFSLETESATYRQELKKSVCTLFKQRPYRWVFLYPIGLSNMVIFNRELVIVTEINTNMAASFRVH